MRNRYILLLAAIALIAPAMVAAGWSLSEGEPSNTAFMAGGALAKGVSSQVAAEKDGPRAYVVVDGEKTEISEGDTVKEASPKEDGVCNLPSMTLRGENLTDAHKSSQIEVSIKADCSVVVSKVGFSPDRLEDPIEDEDDEDAHDGEEVGPGDTGYPGVAGAWGVGASSQEYRGASASALHEPLDIAVTRATAGMDYYDYGSSVGGGHNRRNRCRAFITFWYIEECTYNVVAKRVQFGL